MKARNVCDSQQKGMSDDHFGITAFQQRGMSDDHFGITAFQWRGMSDDLFWIIAFQQRGMSDDRFCITATCASKFTSGMCIGNWKVFTLSLKHLTLLYPFRDGGGWQGSTSQVTDPERLQRAYVAAKESLTVWFYWDPDRMASFLMNNPKTQPVFTENQNEWPAFSQGTRPNGQFSLRARMSGQHFHRKPDQMGSFFTENQTKWPDFSENQTKLPDTTASLQEVFLRKPHCFLSSPDLLCGIKICQ